MFVLVGLLIATGWWGDRAFEELHEGAAYVLLVVIGAHLASLPFHTVRHRENIAQSMVDGRKVAPPQAAISSSRSLAGLAIATASCLLLFALFRGYDASTGEIKLPALSSTLTLPIESGAAGMRSHEHQDENKKRRDSKHDDD